MAREKSPAFQWYAKDFLSDGPCVAMSCAEVGAYVRLLSFCWVEESLPTSDAALARMAGLSNKEWASMSATVMGRFTLVDGCYRHGRLDKERVVQAKWREKSASGGRKSQLNRSHKATTVEPPLPPPLPPPLQPKTDSSDRRSQIASSEECVHTPPPPPLASRSEHRSHAACGRACLPAFLFREFVQLRGGPEDAARAEVDAWAMSLIRAIGDGGARAAESIGDPLKWWRTQWEAAHPAEAPVVQGPSQAELDASLEKELAYRARLKGVR